MNPLETTIDAVRQRIETHTSDPLTRCEIARDLAALHFYDVAKSEEVALQIVDETARAVLARIALGNLASAFFEQRDER